MTKETQTQAIAEPFKFKNAALLNRLSEMAQVPYYATACHTLIQAEMAIVELERENATLRAEVERLAARSAPPVHIRDRWNIERDGEDLLVCFNDHEKAEGCTYQRFTLASDVAQAAPTEPTDYKALGLSLLAKAQAQVFDSDAASNEAFDNTFHKIAADVSRDRWNKIWRMAAQWQRYYTIRNRGAQSPAQAPVQPVSLTDVLQAAAPAEIADAQAPVVLAVQPEYCTACDMTSNDKQRCEDCPRRASSGAAQAAPFAKDSWQHAVDNQLVAFGRTSQEFVNPHEAMAWLAEMHMELGVSNAGATQAVRMLTREELNDVALSEKVGWGPGEYVEAVQRAFCRINAGKRIPADGEVRS